MKTEKRDVDKATNLICSSMILLGAIAGFVFGICFEVYGGLVCKIAIVFLYTLGGIMLGAGMIAVIGLVGDAISTIHESVFKRD